MSSSSVEYAALTLLSVVLTAVLALAGFVIREWVKGNLVPRSYYEDQVARTAAAEASEARAEEREAKWREANERGAETIRLLSEPMGRIAAISGTTSQIIAAALPAATEAAPDLGGAGVPVA